MGGNSFTPLNTETVTTPIFTTFRPEWQLLCTTPAPNFTKTQQTVWSMILSQAHGAMEGDGFHTRKRFILRKGHLNLNSWNSPFCDPSSPSASQVISLILWNLKNHCRVRNSLQPVTDLTQRNPVHTNLSYFYRAHLNIISHIRLGFPNGLSDLPI